MHTDYVGFVDESVDKSQDPPDSTPGGGHTGVFSGYYQAQANDLASRYNDLVIKQGNYPFVLIGLVNTMAFTAQVLNIDNGQPYAPARDNAADINADITAIFATQNPPVEILFKIGAVSIIDTTRMAFVLFQLGLTFNGVKPLAPTTRGFKFYAGGGLPSEDVIWLTNNAVVDGVKVTATAGFYNSSATGNKYAARTGTGLIAGMSFIPGLSGGDTQIGFYDQGLGGFQALQKGFIAGFIYNGGNNIQAYRLGSPLGNPVLYERDSTVASIDISDTQILWKVNGATIHTETVTLDEIGFYPSVRWSGEGHYVSDVKLSGREITPR